MSRYKTLWGMYHINVSRTEGYSDFFETYEDALNARNHAPQIGQCYVIKQTYELEDEPTPDKPAEDTPVFMPEAKQEWVDAGKERFAAPEALSVEQNGVIEILDEFRIHNKYSDGTCFNDGVAHASIVSRIDHLYQSKREAELIQAKIDELKRAKMQSMISGPLMHKVDRRIASLERQLTQYINGKKKE